MLEIEITDSAQGPEGDDVSALIRTLREAGFAVSIDDFGVQYANLPLFTSVDFDVLKIDKGLVDNIVTNEKAQAMVRALAHVCQVMNIRTIAEGVETEEQFAMLKKLGFGAAQGYLFSREQRQLYLRAEENHLSARPHGEKAEGNRQNP